VFFQRLAEAPAVATAEGAYTLLVDTLNTVEDEMSGVPADPTQWETDGRLYPPQTDRRSQAPERPTVTRYRSFKHVTYIGPNGAIEITTTSREVVFRKAGADGKHVWEL
jgi:hypothetical protein